MSAKSFSVARSIAFVGVVCLLLLAPFFVLVLEKCGFSLPSWANGEEASYLEGTVGRAASTDSYTLEGFLQGQFQEAAEEKVEDCVPCREVAFLATAAWQREAIKLSNRVFQWPCFPTFFGSEIAVDTCNGRLLEVPLTPPGEVVAEIERNARAIKAFSERFKGDRVYVYLGPDSLNVEGSPVSALVTDFVSYQESMEVLGKLSGPRVHLIDGDITYADYQDDFFRSDHHWNAEGSYEAYCRISKAMGLTLIPFNQIKATRYEVPPFYGSLARRGLITDYRDKMSLYEVEGESWLSVGDDDPEASKIALTNGAIYDRKAWDGHRFKDRYSELYHENAGLIIIRNAKNSGNGDLLIIGDSYSNCIERLLAMQFEVTYVIDPRQYKGGVEGFLSEHKGVGTVLFLMRQTNLFSQATADAVR